MNDLIVAARSALRPTAADRERVFQALLPKLAANPGPQMLQAGKSAAGVSRAGLLKVSAVVVGLGLTGASLFFALDSKPTASNPAPPPQPAETAAPALAPVPEGAPADAVAEPPPRAPARSVPSQRAPDSLAQEVEILSRAGAELHAGRAASALSVLDEHRRKFPKGVLTQERTAARARALCMLGRTKEAEADLQRLAKMSPNSPHEARARKACGAALTGKN